MAHYCAARKCFVDTETNKRLRGMWRVASQKYCPVYVPPDGMGRRTRYSGLEAGKNLDEGVTALIKRDLKKITLLPKWHVQVARKIIKTLHRARIFHLQSQVVVHNKKQGIATAIDILGKSTRSKKTWILELKYCGHNIQNVKRCYRLPSKVRPRMNAIKKTNSLFERHKLQLRETVRLYRQNTRTPAASIEAGVIVACGCGSLLFYKL